ncbi:dTDP-4-dehydrorhamnose 3,5-epimerase family protein [Algoriphagus jejuensis]|uniref:dTDP-4-dehydrorhamnose 3,5-epimerase n=1 Tax=Algoriphagus jejuensis TaxID=419934 RepID=A0ABN1N1T7_9BACT
MDIIKTKIPGCYEIHKIVRKDTRGRLVKTFSEKTFQEMALHRNFPEVYYSVSNKNVLRGLHFQIPSQHHVKLVACLQGSILDAVVDLRIESPTYGENILVELNPDKANMLYIPAGCAHGFYSLTENTIFLNKTSTGYSQKHDRGIHWDSCGIDWPTNKPIVSEKDKHLIDFASYNSPFRYQEAI